MTTTNLAAALIADVNTYDWYGERDNDGPVVLYADVLAVLTAALDGVDERAGEVLEGVTGAKWHEANDENDCVFNDNGLPVAFYVAPADRRFIAWCREGVPALIALATAQAAQIEGLEAEADNWRFDAECEGEDKRDAAYSAAEWQRRAEAAETALAAMTKERDELRARLEIDHFWVMRDGELVREEGDPGVDGIGCRDATIELLDAALAAERAKTAKLVEAGKALNVRELVSGWNGEGLEKPYTPHAPHLRATIKTTCGAVYALDAALSEAEAKK